MAFQYSKGVRPDIADAHQDYWRKLTLPGSWWTSAERIAIAVASREALECAFCASRKQALSPYAMSGEHASSSDTKRVLPTLAVDAVHRIVTDQSRISKGYIESNQQQGLSTAAYVELVGIVVAVFSIDEFHRALGLPLEPLPEATDGEPDQYTPEKLASDTGFVPMIPGDGAVGQDADLWSSKGSANVVRALSLVPNAVRDWMAIGDAQYLSFEGMGNFDQPESRSLNRMQIELVAGRVSAINECFY